MTPGKLIRKHREKLGMTQLQLAKALGYEIPQFVSLCENEHSKVPKAKCELFIKTLGIPAKTFYLSMLREEKIDLQKACGL